MYVVFISFYTNFPVILRDRYCLNYFVTFFIIKIAEYVFLFIAIMFVIITITTSSFLNDYLVYQLIVIYKVYSKTSLIYDVMNYYQHLNITIVIAIIFL